MPDMFPRLFKAEFLQFLQYKWHIFYLKENFLSALFRGAPPSSLWHCPGKTSICETESLSLGNTNKEEGELKDGAVNIKDQIPGPR